METKFVLHGGGAQHTNAQNDEFFKEILKDTPDTLNVLLVHFAGSPEKAEMNIENDTAQFERNSGEKTLNIEIANESNFLDQLEKADIVYLGGGTTIRLLKSLQSFPNFSRYLAGKVVAGESAGANVLSVYCFSKSGGGIMKCLGIVPIKVIPHYEEKYEVYKKKLVNIQPDLEILTLDNYRYKVILSLR